VYFCSVPPITVSHRTGSYQVDVSPGITAEMGTRITALLPGRRLALVTDPTIRVALTGNGLWPAIEATVIEVPAGERAKSREEWARVTDQLLALELGRDSALVALGGGSIGDLTGFVAATYLRGVPFVQVPTTLLAMVDASVGGKVGVDTGAGKNLVGAFHPPALVLADPALLATLPDRGYREGLAEAVKHGVVADTSYFDWIAANAAGLVKRDPKLVAQLVTRSVEIKAGVVSRDELETGERAILNAGHTVAHALEQLSNYTLAHGEAVAIGLVEECRISEGLGSGEKGLADSVSRLLAELGLPTQSPLPTPRPQLFAAMRTDKKNRAGKIRMALPAAIGRMARDGAGWTVEVGE
jgi:3-dehydroquinate synthase